MFTGITGLILAGGRSSRMGANKCLLAVGGMPAIQRTAELLRSLFPRVLVSTNSPEEFGFLGLPCVADAHPGAGPLAGISAGLHAASTERVFVISCDMPLMTGEIISHIAGHRTSKPITAASVAGEVQPLCAVYSRSFLPEADRILDDPAIRRPGGKHAYRLRDLLTPERAALVEFSSFGDAVTTAFLNMNVPEDHLRIRRLLDNA